MTKAGTHRVQIVKDAAGHPVAAVIPWEEYERLRAGGDEDAQLIAAAERHRGEERFPEEVARRLAAGEVGLKVIREWRGLTQAELGERANVPPQYISQIERDDRNMGLKTAAKLAPILKVSPEVLLDGLDQGFQRRVRRKTRRANASTNKSTTQ